MCDTVFWWKAEKGFSLCLCCCSFHSVGVTLALNQRKCTRSYRKSLGLLELHQLSAIGLHFVKWIINVYKNHQSKVMECLEEQQGANPPLRLGACASRACGEDTSPSKCKLQTVIVCESAFRRPHELPGLGVRWFWLVRTVFITISNVAIPIHHRLPLRFTYHSVWFRLL